jgi:hypothetical protein
VRKPWDGLQLLKKSPIGIAMGQHIHLMAGLAACSCDITDVNRPVAIARLERFFKNEDLQCC